MSRRRRPVLLYNPPSSPDHKPLLPLSLLALGAGLEGRYAYQIVDGNLEPDRALWELLAAAPDSVLGVTVMPGPQLAYAASLCREVKRRYPGVLIAWGGYFPSQHYEVCLRSGRVDVVLRGYADHAWRAWLDALASGGDISSVPGLARLDPETGAMLTRPPGPLPDPAVLPPYPYHRLDLARYARATVLGRRTLSHHASYGCPFACGFCAVTALSGGVWRAQSPAQVAAAAQTLVRRGRADALEFFDSNFFASEARSAEIGERLRPLQIAWWAQGRIDTLVNYSETTWRRLQAGGLKMIFMGAEAGTPEALAELNKGGSQTPAQTLALAEVLDRHGIIPELSFVLGQPPEPEAETELTFEFIRRLKARNPKTEIVLYLYTPVPADNRLFARAQAAGFSFPATLEEWLQPEWQEFSLRRSACLPWLSPRLRRRIRDFETVLNAYYPTAADPAVRGLRRRLPRSLAAWRYHLRIYARPVELRLVRKLWPHQRPETAGF